LGTYNTLRLDVVRTDPPAAGPTPVEESLLAGEELIKELHGEIATVLYLFVPPATSAMDASPDGPGLKRREVRLNQSSEQDIELAKSLAESNLGAYSSPPSLDSSRSTTVGLLPADTDLAALLPDTSLSLPEVVALEFRYFDGRDWTDAWDSRARRGLPSAVEVSFELDIAKPSRRAPRTSGATNATNSSSTAAPTAPTPTLDDLHERKPSYRFVVYLPQSSLAGKRSEILDSAEEEPEDPSLLDSELPPEPDSSAAAGETQP